MRLINPVKNKFGRISKAILDNINKRLCTSLNINQWKNTASVLEWFKRIEQKHLYKFIMFDIKDFYLSIQEELKNKRITACLMQSFLPSLGSVLFIYEIKTNKQLQLARSLIFN